MFDKEKRRMIAEQALASTRLAHGKISEELAKLAALYIEGDISAKQISAALKNKHRRNKTTKCDPT